MPETIATLTITLTADGVITVAGVGVQLRSTPFADRMLDMARQIIHRENDQFLVRPATEADMPQ